MVLRICGKNNKNHGWSSQEGAEDPDRSRGYLSGASSETGCITRFIGKCHGAAGRPGARGQADVRRCSNSNLRSWASSSSSGGGKGRGRYQPLWEPDQTALPDQRGHRPMWDRVGGVPTKELRRPI
eukprot:XP_001706366.1 Hypothetical protein GL50803_20002 [Giardia lamblia ATCC 50803]